MKKQILKHIALGVALIFTTTTVAWAGGVNVYSVKVPEKYGKVTQRWRATQGISSKINSIATYPPSRGRDQGGEELSDSADHSNKTVILIQDAHASYEAQKNIAHIIGSLTEQKQQREQAMNSTNKVASSALFVGLEGGVGEIDTRLYGSYPDRDIRALVSDYFLKGGRVSGAEYQSIVNDSSLALYGIEDKSLYVDNYMAYRDVAELSDGILETLEEIEAALEDFSVTGFSDPLRAFIKQVIAYRHKNADFFSFCDSIISTAQEVDIDLLTYVNLYYFSEAVMSIRLVDEERCEKECGDLLAVLAEQGEIPVNKKECAEKEYFGQLRAMISAYKLDQTQYRHIIAKANALSKMAAVNMQPVMQELMSVQWEIAERLARAESEMIAVPLMRTVSLLKGLLKLEAVPHDVNYFRQHRKEFTEETITTMLRSITHPQIDSHPEGSVFYDEGSFVLSGLNQVLEKVDAFYGYAEKRNAVLVEKTLAEAAENNAADDFIVMVAGGYHADGIAEELKKQNISHAVIVPELSSLSQDIPYAERMMLEPFALEQLVNSVSFSTLSLPRNETLIAAIQDIVGADIDVAHGLFDRTYVAALFFTGLVQYVVSRHGADSDGVRAVFHRHVKSDFSDYQSLLDAWQALENSQFRLSDDGSTVSFDWDKVAVRLPFDELFATGIADGIALVQEGESFALSPEQITAVYTLVLDKTLAELREKHGQSKGAGSEATNQQSQVDKVQDEPDLSIVRSRFTRALVSIFLFATILFGSLGSIMGVVNSGLSGFVGAGISQAATYPSLPADIQEAVKALQSIKYIGSGSFSIDKTGAVLVGTFSQGSQQSLKRKFDRAISNANVVVEVRPLVRNGKTLQQVFLSSTHVLQDELTKLIHAKLVADGTYSVRDGRIRLGIFAQGTPQILKSKFYGVVDTQRVHVLIEPMTVNGKSVNAVYLCPGGLEKKNVEVLPYAHGEMEQIAGYYDSENEAKKGLADFLRIYRGWYGDRIDGMVSVRQIADGYGVFVDYGSSQQLDSFIREILLRCSSIIDVPIGKLIELQKKEAGGYRRHSATGALGYGMIKGEAMEQVRGWLRTLPQLDKNSAELEAKKSLGLFESEELRHLRKQKQILGILGESLVTDSSFDSYISLDRLAQHYKMDYSLSLQTFKITSKEGKKIFGNNQLARQISVEADGSVLIPKTYYVMGVDPVVNTLVGLVVYYGMQFEKLQHEQRVIQLQGDHKKESQVSVHAFVQSDLNYNMGSSATLGLVRKFGDRLFDVHDSKGNYLSRYDWFSMKRSAESAEAYAQLAADELTQARKDVEVAEKTYADAYARFQASRTDVKQRVAELSFNMAEEDLNEAKEKLAAAQERADQLALEAAEQKNAVSKWMPIIKRDEPAIYAAQSVVYLLKENPRVRIDSGVGGDRTVHDRMVESALITIVSAWERNADSRIVSARKKLISERDQNIKKVLHKRIANTYAEREFYRSVIDDIHTFFMLKDGARFINWNVCIADIVEKFKKRGFGNFINKTSFVTYQDIVEESRDLDIDLPEDRTVSHSEEAGTSAAFVAGGVMKRLLSTPMRRTIGRIVVSVMLFLTMLFGSLGGDFCRFGNLGVGEVVAQELVVLMPDAKKYRAPKTVTEAWVYMSNVQSYEGGILYLPTSSISEAQMKAQIVQKTIPGAEVQILKYSDSRYRVFIKSLISKEKAKRFIDQEVVEKLANALGTNKKVILDRLEKEDGQRPSIVGALGPSQLMAPSALQFWLWTKELPGVIERAKLRVATEELSENEKYVLRLNIKRYSRYLEKVEKVIDSRFMDFSGEYVPVKALMQLMGVSSDEMMKSFKLNKKPLSTWSEQDKQLYITNAKLREALRVHNGRLEMPLYLFLSLAYEPLNVVVGELLYQFYFDEVESYKKIAAQIPNHDDALHSRLDTAAIADAMYNSGYIALKAIRKHGDKNLYNFVYRSKGKNVYVPYFIYNEMSQQKQKQLNVRPVLNFETADYSAQFILNMMVKYPDYQLYGDSLSGEDSAINDELIRSAISRSLAHKWKRQLQRAINKRTTNERMRNKKEKNRYVDADHDVEFYSYILTELEYFSKGERDFETLMMNVFKENKLAYRNTAFFEDTFSIGFDRFVAVMSAQAMTVPISNGFSAEQIDKLADKAKKRAVLVQELHAMKSELVHPVSSDSAIEDDDGVVVASDWLASQKKEVLVSEAKVAEVEVGVSDDSSERSAVDEEQPTLGVLLVSKGQILVAFVSWLCGFAVSIANASIALYPHSRWLDEKKVTIPLFQRVHHARRRVIATNPVRVLFVRVRNVFNVLVWLGLHIVRNAAILILGSPEYLRNKLQRKGYQVQSKRKGVSINLSAVDVVRMGVFIVGIGLISTLIDNPLSVILLGLQGRVTFFLHKKIKEKTQTNLRVRRILLWLLYGLNVVSGLLLCSVISHAAFPVGGNGILVNEVGTNAVRVIASLVFLAVCVGLVYLMFKFRAQKKADYLQLSSDVMLSEESILFRGDYVVQAWGEGTEREIHFGNQILTKQDFMSGFSFSSAMIDRFTEALQHYDSEYVFDVSKIRVIVLNNLQKRLLDVAFLYDDPALHSGALELGKVTFSELVDLREHKAYGFVVCLSKVEIPQVLRVRRNIGEESIETIIRMSETGRLEFFTAGALNLFGRLGVEEVVVPDAAMQVMNASAHKKETHLMLERFGVDFQKGGQAADGYYCHSKEALDAHVKLMQKDNKKSRENMFEVTLSSTAISPERLESAISESVEARRYRISCGSIGQKRETGAVVDVEPTYVFIDMSAIVAEDGTLAQTAQGLKILTDFYDTSDTAGLFMKKENLDFVRSRVQPVFFSYHSVDEMQRILEEIGLGSIQFSYLLGDVNLSRDDDLTMVLRVADESVVIREDGANAVAISNTKIGLHSAKIMNFSGWIGLVDPNGDLGLRWVRKKMRAKDLKAMIDKEKKVSTVMGHVVFFLGKMLDGEEPVGNSARVKSAYFTYGEEERLFLQRAIEQVTKVTVMEQAA